MSDSKTIIIVTEEAPIVIRGVLISLGVPGDSLHMIDPFEEQGEEKIRIVFTPQKGRNLKEDLRYEGFRVYDQQPITLVKAKTNTQLFIEEKSSPKKKMTRRALRALEKNRAATDSRGELPKPPSLLTLSQSQRNKLLVEKREFRIEVLRIIHENTELGKLFHIPEIKDDEFNKKILCIFPIDSKFSEYDCPDKDESIMQMKRYLVQKNFILDTRVVLMSGVFITFERSISHTIKKPLIS